jgi:hypothetical protein
VWRAALRLSAFVSAAKGQTVWTICKAAPDGAGDWSDANNWNAGVPTSETHAAVVNGSEVRLGDATAEAQSLMLAGAFGGAVVQTTGRLAIENGLNIASGSYRLTGGELRSGSLDLSVSDVALIVPVTPDIPLPEGGGCVPSEHGICVPSIVFGATQSRFWLDGGTVTLTGSANVGRARMEIRGGLLDAESLMMDASGWDNSSHEVTQAGGVVVLREALKVQDGTYELAGGRLTAARFGMGNPLIEVTWFGTTRAPAFVQSGGSFEVLGDLEMCVPGFIWPPIEIAPLFREIAFRLQGGELNVGGNVIVGSLGAAPATFVQSGGQATVAGALRVEGTESRYEMSGGTLQTRRIEIGMNVVNEGGTLSLGPAAELTVEEGVRFGAEAVLEIVESSDILLKGGEFEIFGQDSTKLAGLGQLSLIVEGDGEVSRMEAAGRDWGAVGDGFVDNFAFAQIRVGGTSGGHLRLVDAIDNTSDSAASDAVYVDRLIVQAGSSLDLGGLNLYYRHAEILGRVVNSGGSIGRVVPEPGSLALTILAILVGWGRSSRVRRSRC